MAGKNGQNGALEGAKDLAAAVVMAYRQVDWEQLEAGDEEAVAALVAANDQHEHTRVYLESQDDDLADMSQTLLDGLDRYYERDVAPKLSHPAVMRQMLAAPPPSMAGPSTMAPMSEGMAPRSRPSVTVGHTMRMNTGCGNLYVTVNEDESGTPFELFNHMGKAGGCAASQNEAIGRLISYALRCGASIEPLIKQLKGISCHRPAWSEDGKISSCADAVGKALEKYNVARPPHDTSPMPVRAPASAAELVAERETLTETETVSVSVNRISTVSKTADHVQGACRDCGSQLVFEEGCVKCYSCGFTECG